MNIIEAIQDESLFRPFLADKRGVISSWQRWQIALRCVYGLKLGSPTHKLVKQCTGRDARKMPAEGFSTAAFLTGRRSGKSRMAAVIAAFESCLAGHETKLSTGEMGLVPVISPTKKQSRIVKGYIRSIFEETPILANEITQEDSEGFSLRNGIRIETLAGDWRSVRGYTLVAAVIDEAAFFGLDAESKVKSDTELIRAIQPALATTNGRLIAISSPYAQKGWCWTTYKRNFGNDNGKTLVWNCASRTMNPTLSQRIVDEALAEDYASAKAEYLGEFRDDVAVCFPREVVEQAVVPNRDQLLYRSRLKYAGFVDMSGGRSDDAVLAIGHKTDEGKLVVDCIKTFKPPFSPQSVIADMCGVLKGYGINRVTGDNYAAEFVAAAFRSNRVAYTKCPKPKSALYLELLPRLCSGEVELLDNSKLVNQLCQLERRTRSGGKDGVDHPNGSHDDVANAVAGLIDCIGAKRHRIGAF